MTKEDFFSSLHDILIDPLSVSGPHIEHKNMWAISISDELSKQISVDEFFSFVQGVIQNRKEQALQLKMTFTFYAWFDWQVAQFRFSVIPRDFNLPFRCEIRQVDLEGIVEQFLDFQFHTNPTEAPAHKVVLDVYSCKLSSVLITES
jgi:hypothetical protein